MSTTGEATRARKLWRTLEPYHGVVYFAQEATEEYAAIGLTGRSGYFVSRAAAMGRVATATVQATFFNFHPDLVAAAMDAAGEWDPDTVLDARLRAMDRVLTTELGDEISGDAMRRAAELAARAARAVPPHAPGRPLAGAHRSLPEPDAAHLQLWWAISVLREFRGDGHLTALVGAELSGLEALVVHAGSGDVPAAILRATRSWSEQEWGDAVSALADRGLVDEDGAHTESGAELWASVEATTDRLAAAPWSELHDDEAAELRELVRPWSRALSARIAG